MNNSELNIARAGPLKLFSRKFPMPPLRTPTVKSFSRMTGMPDQRDWTPGPGAKPWSPRYFRNLIWLMVLCPPDGPGGPGRVRRSLQGNQDRDQPPARDQGAQRLADHRAERPAGVGGLHGVAGGLGRGQQVADVDGVVAGVDLA